MLEGIGKRDLKRTSRSFLQHATTELPSASSVELKRVEIGVQLIAALFKNSVHSN